VIETLDLQYLITQQKSELTLLKPRFRTRLFYMRGRLLLLQVGPSESGITASNYQVRDRLDSIEINLQMGVPDRQGQEKGRWHMQHGAGGSIGTRQRVT